MAAFFTSDYFVGCLVLKECDVNTSNVIKHTPITPLALGLALWGIFQVLMILLNAIRRLWSRAMLPLKNRDLNSSQYFLLVSTIIFMMYKEGYEAFQLKYAPLVVRRAFSLYEHDLTIMNTLFTGPFAMGMFTATYKRKLISWSLFLGITGLVQIVKRLKYPYRNIVDCGVVAGLSYGSIAILIITIKVLYNGILPNIDPCFVEPNANANANPDVFVGFGTNMFKGLLGLGDKEF
jgi:hypothetical protein